MVELFNELEAQVQSADAMEMKIEKLQAKNNEYDASIHKLQLEVRELKSKDEALRAARDVFKDPTTQKEFLFPVMQNNGEMVDLFRIISTWAKSAGEDDHHPYRTYPCPSKFVSTNLAQLPFTSFIHQIASGMGIVFEPPIRFEFQRNSTWHAFNMKDQVYLAAKTCFIYVNRNDQDDTTQVTESYLKTVVGLITFLLAKVRNHFFPEAF